MKHDVSALALSETLSKMMTETHGPWPRGMRRRQEKEATAATFIDLTKQAIEA
jgi:hypothetical protein